MKINQIIIIFLLVALSVLFSSCEKELNANIGDDFYQESKREVKTENLSYRLKNDVVFMTPYMLDNVINVVEDSILILKSNTDELRLPSIGQVLLLSQESNKVPAGFVGRIKSITKDSGKIEIVTTSVDLHDLFSEFTCHVEASPADYEIYDEEGNIIPSEKVTEEEDTEDQMVSDDETDRIDEEVNDLSRVSGTVTYSREFKLKISMFPQLNTEGIMRIGGLLKLDIKLSDDYVKLDAIINATLKVGVKATIGQSLGFDKTKKFIGRIPITPIASMPAISVPISLYSYELYDGKVELDASVTAKCTPSASITYNKGSVSGKLNFKSNKKMLNGDLKLKGKLSYGIGLRSYSGVGLYKWEVARMKYIYVDAYSKLEGNTEINLTDMDDASISYAILKNANVNFSAKGGLYVEKKGFLRFFKKKQSDASTTTDILERSVKLNLGTMHLLPQISTSSVKPVGTTVNASFKYNRTLLLPVQCGFSVYFDGKEVATHYHANSYWFVNNNDIYTFSFSNLQKGSYYMSPTFKLLGTTIRGNEKYCFSIGDEPVNQELKGVDLGLSVIWSDRNLGASSPSVVGKLYGLGNTLENVDYSDVDNYSDKWYPINAKMAKYFGFPEQPYGKTYYVNINGTPFEPTELPEGWRVPTLSELIELKHSTSVAKSELNGVKGYTFTGNNGNSIFVPITGLRSEPEYSNTLKMMGATGALENSENGWYSYASGITLPSIPYHDENCYWNTWPGCIRPVKDKK